MPKSVKANHKLNSSGNSNWWNHPLRLAPGHAPVSRASNLLRHQVLASVLVLVPIRMRILVLCGIPAKWKSLQSRLYSIPKASVANGDMEKMIHISKNFLELGINYIFIKTTLTRFLLLGDYIWKKTMLFKNVQTI